MGIEELIKQGATLIDVRTVEEFEEGSVEGAINIPLHTIPSHVDEFKDMKPPIVCFCRSGNRSNQAMLYLKSQGVETFNGGGMEDMMKFMSQ